MYEEKDYAANFDQKFIDEMGIEFMFYQPWQIGLFPEEFYGEFVWYPMKGTLMVEPEGGYSRKLGEFTDTESMYNRMMSEVYKNNYT